VRVPLVPWSCAGYGKLTCHLRICSYCQAKRPK